MAQSLLTDVTSLTNLGIIARCLPCRGMALGLSKDLPDLPARAWIATVIAGFLLGYSSRLAFGCNVGAFFSRHLDRQPARLGLVRRGLRAARIYGIKLRPWLGLEARS